MKIDRETLIQRRNRVLQWVQSEGAVFCYDENKIQRLKDYLVDMPAVFPELLQEGLCAIYLYCQADQPEHLSAVDGICWRDVTTDGCGNLYAIGISVEALARGPEYVQLCFLHELAHVCYGGDHTMAFHAGLDSLIARFNEKNGSSISNDYYGIKERSL